MPVATNSVAIKIIKQLLPRISFQGWFYSKTHEKRLEIYTVFVAISSKTAALTLWLLVIGTAAVCTAVGHILNSHKVVDAIILTSFCAVFSHWMTGFAVQSAVSPSTNR